MNKNDNNNESARQQTARVEVQTRAMAACVAAGVPVILWGAPGVAKTAFVEGTLSRLCVAHHTSIAALHDPPEYGGYPSPVAATEAVPAHVAQLPVGWVLRLRRAALEHPRARVGLFLDEVSNAPPATRSACMRGVLDGTWGEVEIPRLSVVAASNPERMSESGYRFSAAFSNRWCHIDWHLGAAYWAEAYSQAFDGGVPEAWTPSPSVADMESAENTQVRHIIAAFAMFRPDLFEDSCPDSEDQQAGPWPSNRTWTMLSRVLGAALAAGEDPDGSVVHMLTRGLVGDGASSAFGDYWRNMNLPSAEKLLSDPDLLPSVWPERGDRRWALLLSIASATINELKPARWRACWKLLGCAASNLGSASYAAPAARQVAAAGRKTWGAKCEIVPELAIFADLLTALGR